MENPSLNSEFALSGINSLSLSKNEPDKDSFVLTGINKEPSLQEQIAAQEAEIEKARQKMESAKSALDFKLTGINAPEQAINPAQEGEVIDVRKNKVSVKHNDGTTSDYHGLTKINVATGDLVKPEAILGYTDQTKNKIILSGINSPQKKVTKVPAVQITGADVISYLGFDPSRVAVMNPSLRSHLITEVAKAKRVNKGGTNQPFTYDEQNSLRERVGLPLMGAMGARAKLEEQYTGYSSATFLTPKSSAEILLGNHKEFPTIYNFAANRGAEAQETYRDKLVEQNKNQLYDQYSVQYGEYKLHPVSIEEITKKAEQQADTQLAFEEQQRLDSVSKTASFTNKAINVGSVLLQNKFGNALDQKRVAQGFAGFVGNTVQQLGSISNLLPNEAGDELEKFGRQVQAGLQVNKFENPIYDPYDALVTNEGLTFHNFKNQFLSDLTYARAGFSEGIGRSPELLKLFGGAALLKAAELPLALNLPVQGAISGIPGGVSGVVQGAAGGLIYHYGGGFFGPYLGRIGNTVLWVGGPAAERNLVEGTPIAEAIGESLPTGIFVGISGGERALITNGETVKSANVWDIPKVLKGEWQFVPPSFRTALTKDDVFNFEPIKTVTIKSENGEDYNRVMTLEAASSRVNELKSELYASMERPLPPEEKDIKISEIRRIQDAIILAKTNGDIDNVPASRQEEINKTLEQDGVFNREEFINRESAYDAQQALINSIILENEKGTQFQSGVPFQVSEQGIFNVIKNKATDLAKLASFHIEDLYHRGLPPDYSVVMNRLQQQIPELVNGMSDVQKREFYSLGLNYWNSNVADPFFSRMKLDAVEKLPNRMTAQQALDVLQGHKTEFEWTVGLEQFLNDKKVEKFSKQELVDIIQRGQVRVVESVADENDPIRIELRKIQSRIDAIYEEDHIEIPQELKELIAYRIKLQQQVGPAIKYSLKAYTGEKLELPGAVNSKEVKLIAPILADVPEFNIKDWKKVANADPNVYSYEYFGPETRRYYPGDYLDLDRPIEKATTRQVIDAYTHSHWGHDLKNVVAHYRSNDRITTDGKRAYHSEEFQSDWNHDIRVAYERGLNDLAIEIGALKYGSEKQDLGVSGLEKLIKEYAKTRAEAPEEILKKLRGLNNGVYAKPPEGMHVEIFDAKTGEQIAWAKDDIEADKYVTSHTEKLLDYTYVEKRGYGDRNQLEPNPFMAHNWKELILKRFIRDAVIAKDENGNYKYDGVSWTTARQQQERYGKVLEGKHFKWQKNSDGTYNFDLGTAENYPDTNEEWQTNWSQPHELRNISLERFAELTTKEAAQEVRDQEVVGAKYWTQRDIRRLKTLRKDLEGVDRNSYVHRELFNERDTLLQKRDEFHNPTPITQGKFSLKEAVELRSGIGKYSDYDVALVNMAKKIGKRFGAEYSLKEIRTANLEKKNNLLLVPFTDADGNFGYEWQRINEKIVGDQYKTREEAIEAAKNFPNVNEFIYKDNNYEPISELDSYNKQNEKVHYLEITPSMRESLSKEGFSLYGLGRVEPLKSSEQGIRNRITTFDIFDEAKSNLISAMASDKNLITPSKESSLLLSQPSEGGEFIESFDPEQRAKIQQSILNAHPDDLETMRQMMRSRGTVLNSGLNPEAFIDQAKLLYSGIKDFATFAKEITTRFGDKIKPYLSDLWFNIKGLWEKFNEPNLLDIASAKEPTTFYVNPLNLIKGLRNIGIDLPSAIDYLNNPEKHQSMLDMRFTHRMIYLAQIDPKFGEVYNPMRKGQRLVNYFQSQGLVDLKAANEFIKKENHDLVGQVLYKGLVNEKRIIPRAELLAGDPAKNRPPLSTKQSDAYEKFYEVEHRNLDIRLDTILYGFRQRAIRLNDKLSTLTQGTPEYLAVEKQIQDISKRMTQVTNYYSDLKKSGYFSLQRQGTIAAFITDANGVKYYQQFEDPLLGKLTRVGLRRAQKWVKQQIANGANASSASIYDIRKIDDLAGAARKLTPAAFEDLVDQSGANPHAPEIEAIRDKVYSQFSTQGYQLARDFVPGYETTWESALSSVVTQLERYGSSFYARVSGNEGFKALTKTGLEKTDNNLYKIAKAYIQDEIIAPESSLALKGLANTRRAVSFIQLGYDFNQFYMNAVAQPLTQTLNYFARVEHSVTTKTASGNATKTFKLTGLEPEKFFLAGGRLAGQVLRESLGLGGKPNAEFKSIYNRLVKERVLAPEYTKSLLEAETKGLGSTVGKSFLQKFTNIEQQEHWASVFMRGGEKTTRTHAAAEAFLVGKKFGLEGEGLVDFIVRAVDATQSNPTRGENPHIIRRGLGNSGASKEFGKLFYQFGTFNHMWLENLGLNVKADLKNKAPAATSRTLIPLALMGGLKGMPLAATALTLYTILSGNDPKKQFDKLLGRDTWLERLVLYGSTQSSGLSSKLTPSFPIVDTMNFLEDRSNIPVYATYQQFQQGVSDLLGKTNKVRAATSLLPKAIRGPITAIEMARKGATNAAGNITVPRSKINNAEIILQGINIRPNPVIEYGEEQRNKKLQRIHNQLKRLVQRKNP